MHSTQTEGAPLPGPPRRGRSPHIDHWVTPNEGRALLPYCTNEATLPPSPGPRPQGPDPPPLLRNRRCTLSIPRTQPDKTYAMGHKGQITQVSVPVSRLMDTSNRNGQPRQHRRDYSHPYAHSKLSDPGSSESDTAPKRLLPEPLRPTPGPQEQQLGLDLPGPVTGTPSSATTCRCDRCQTPQSSWIGGA
jgi:hypothetical protein